MKRNVIYKTVAICAIALLGFNSANAQLRFGPILGLNLANFSGDVENNSMLIGAHLGAAVNFSVSDNFKVEPQLLFSMQGSKYEIDIPFFGTEEYDYKLNYIQVPIWLRYQTDGGFNVQAGPYVGLLLSAKADGEDAKDGLSGLDFGVGGGIGYQMESGLGFAANYNIGLANVNDEGPGDIKNTLIRVSVSYMLGGD